MADFRYQYEEIEKHRLLAERKEAMLEGRPYAIPIDFPVEWCMGAPLPTLLQSEARTLLFFYLEGKEDRVAQVEFHGVCGTKFGQPDGNGFDDHPLAGSGLEVACLMEVIGSPWIAELVQVMAIHGVTTESFSGRHFIMPFHDSTFECVAHSFSVKVVDTYLLDAVEAAVRAMR